MYATRGNGVSIHVMQSPDQKQNVRSSGLPPVNLGAR